MNTSLKIRQPKILLVEDDADSRALVKRALQDDYEVEVASGGLAALEILDAGEPPALILLDLSMPGMSGEKFIEKIRERPNASQTKIVLMSGWDDLAKRCQALGASGWIRKPVDLDRLDQEIASHLATSSTNQVAS